MFRTKPVGPQDQPDFVNTVLEAETKLQPLPLLLHLKEIEAEMGRTKTGRWGPRVIDLDIILYGSMVLDDPVLTIPHKQMTQRRFVLAPLARLAPDLIVPKDGRTVAECLADLDDDPTAVWEVFC